MVLKKYWTETVVILIIFLSACTTGGTRVSTEKRLFGISFFWGSENMCRDGHSPRINLKNVPPETRSLEVQLEDVNMLRVHHGTNRIPYTGFKYIRPGALRDYMGPCPQRGHTHRYRFTVYALDEKGNVIGKAEQIRNCSNIE